MDVASSTQVSNPFHDNYGTTLLWFCSSELGIMEFGSVAKQEKLHRVYTSVVLVNQNQY